jgi:very-short-patch-repair endonuclease
LHNNIEYPAKHIRWLAYRIANKKEISKESYNGGEKTVIFFNQRGFKCRYNGELVLPAIKRNSRFTYDDPSQIKVIKKKDTVYKKATLPEKKPKTSIKGLNVVDQKNALHVLLQQQVGIIHTEKRFEWMRTPDPKKLPPEYKPITDALKKYRKQAGFLRPNYQLLCDIVVDNLKMIVEYDEDQHFSKARLITLEQYPPKIKLWFSRKEWMDYCKKLDRHDNAPVDRDERRAFYDSVRDIEAHRNGYKLVRIKHGKVDWSSPDAVNALKDILKNIKTKTL